MTSRRGFFCTLGALGLGARAAASESAPETGDWMRLRQGYAQRLKSFLAQGELPYIDVESSCNGTKVDVDVLAQSMDTLRIGLMALSSDIGVGQFNQGVRFDDLSQRLLMRYPDRFIPVGNGGQPPAMTQAPDEFLAAQKAAAVGRKILLFGEFEFRHYPSPRQAKRGDMDRDVEIPIDGPVGHSVFRMSEETGLPIQLHYEIEDALLPPLEAMLTRYPNAKVIWCHLAQIRYIERASRYSASYVEDLIRCFPQLYFDTAFGHANSVYPLSKQKQSRIWGAFGIRPQWLDLIVAYPDRFLSALDLGQDRLDRIAEYDAHHRTFLKQLPMSTQHQVAYRNAWKLLFGQEWSA